MSASDAVERFWRKANRAEGCWLWTGTKIAQGYGTLAVGGKDVRAHRFSYELHHGPIPAGQMVCHSCDTPLCVNPNHLFLGTAQQNTDDMMSKGRRKGGQKPGTACKKGHSLTAENTYTGPDGRRRCRICMRAKDTRNRVKRAAARPRKAVANV